MRTIIPVAAAAVAAALAQSPSPSPQGRYHFVRLTAGNRPAGVATMGGTWEFDGKGGLRLAARRGEGASAAVEVAGTGTYTLAGHRLRMESAALNGPLELLVSADGKALTGPIAARTYDFCVAVKAPENATPRLVEGQYGGGYLGLRNGERRQLATAFLELAADGRGGIPEYALTGHLGRVDDVNRRQTGQGLAFTMSATGSGRLRFPPKSDFAAGEREILAAEDGAVILGFGAGAGERDVFVLVRKARESSVFSLSGGFWLSEISAANSWVYNPDGARWNSGAGLLRLDGAGNGLLAQQTRHLGRSVQLVTAAPYRVGIQGTGTLGADPVPDGNMALGGGNPPLALYFAGARVGAEEKLTLEHGIFFGVRAPGGAGIGSVLAAGARDAKALEAPAPVADRFRSGAAALATREDFSLVDGSNPARPGEKLFLFVAGFASAGKADVRFSGVAAEVGESARVANLEGVGRLSVTVPAGVPAGRDAVVTVSAEDAFSDVLDLPVAAR